MQANYIPDISEVDVLIGVTKWLHKECWEIKNISLARGQGISQNKEKVKTKLANIGISVTNIKFTTRGEDIRAEQGNNIWKIECKGLSSGKSETIKNNFDRAVASTVSYYDQRGNLRIGLALPEGYNKFLREKLPKALRIAINLWVFFWADYDDVLVFPPNEEIYLK